MELIEANGITDQNCKFLKLILPKQLIDRSMKLIYQEAKIKYHTAILSERCFWTFYSHGKTYYVFCDHNSSFCSCPSYEKDVIQEGRFPFCKHVLASFLCDALRKREDANQFIVDEMNDDDFAMFMADTVVSSSLDKHKKK